MNQILIHHIASRALDLMRRQKIILEGERPVFYAWPRQDRLILVVDPEMVRNQGKILSAEFRHDLSTILAGRRVVQTNSRGIFLQVAYTPPPAPLALRSEPLDLAKQPSALHLPIGNTRSGPFWISLAEADSLLIGGRRRMGKSRLMHACIQALIHGGQAELVLRDGKGGMEFARYSRHGCVRVVQHNFRETLVDLQMEVNRREKIQLSAGVTSIAEYNALHPEARLPAIALVVDEIADLPEDCRPILAELIGRCGAYGVHPILGTTYPGYKEVGSLIKANLGLRIALAVPTQNESRVILGMKGAEELPNIRGRMLFEWNARLVEAQAFEVSLPEGGSYLGPALSGQELAIARYAVETGSALSIGLLKQSYSMTDKLAYNLLRDWESRGWVEKDRFHGNARIPTLILREVIGKSGETGKSGKTGKSEDL